MGAVQCLSAVDDDASRARSTRLHDSLGIRIAAPCATAARAESHLARRHDEVRAAAAPVAAGRGKLRRAEGAATAALVTRLADHHWLRLDRRAERA